MGILLFIVALGIIVIVHELGHLIVAKKNGVFCHEFSIGMGPKIYEITKDKTGTVYNLRLIPLGGYVQMAGEDTGLEEDEKIPKEQKFNSKSKWIKFQILIAGILMNFLLGLIFLFFVAIFSGNFSTNHITVQENSLIAKAGVKSGAEIQQINNQETKTYQDIINYLESSSNKEMEFTIKNSDNTVKVIQIVKPTADTKIGISPYKEPSSFKQIIQNTFNMFLGTFKMIFQSIYLLFTPQYGIKDLSGPVGIAEMSNEVANYGFIAGMAWIAFLSINIGFMNLLPIPALDGGRILFIIIELISRRKLNQNIEETVNLITLYLLLGLFIFVTYNDIIRLFVK